MTYSTAVKTVRVFGWKLTKNVFKFTWILLTVIVGIFLVIVDSEIK